MADPTVTPMHRSILFLYAKIIALTASAILLKNGIMITLAKTSLILDLSANPSMVSTTIPLIREIIIVTTANQTRPH